MLIASTSFPGSYPKVSIQDDGSFAVVGENGSVLDSVKQGTPVQSIQVGDQSCKVSYAINSIGKKIILVSIPATSTAPLEFILGDRLVGLPPKCTLRVTLTPNHQIEKMDGNPGGMVRFETIPESTSSSASASTLTPPIPTQSSPVPGSAPSNALPEPRTITQPAESRSAEPSPDTNPKISPVPSETSPPDSLVTPGWPGKLLDSPIPENQMEEEKFYARTEFGPRFVSSMNLVSVSGPNGNYGILNQKEIAFSTGYRQDLDLGVWLTDWFGLAAETGFALNAVRGNTTGMSVSSTTFWTVPILAQICFQYPNDSGWIPYLNFGFGGGWTLFKVGGINYTQPGGPSIPFPLSGTGSSVNNAYQIAAGVRYRLYEDLSITLAYKFYGNSQANINLDNGVQATLGSPVTNSAEVGVNFSF